MKNRSSCLKFLISTGPTREHIDPVRYISNPSTGAIGYALAAYAAQRGYKVILLSGPTHLKPPKNVKVVYFISALDLKKKAELHFPWADCFIGAAAVGDYRAAKISKRKMKKENGINAIKLIKNPDIIASLGKKKKGKIVIGFALETENVVKNAFKKLTSKNLDMVIANQLSPLNSPFGKNRVSSIIVTPSGSECLGKIAKPALARIILDRAVKLCYSLKNKKKEANCAKA